MRKDYISQELQYRIAQMLSDGELDDQEIASKTGVDAAKIGRIRAGKRRCLGYCESHVPRVRQSASSLPTPSEIRRMCLEFRRLSPRAPVCRTESRGLRQFGFSRTSRVSWIVSERES